MKLKNIVVNTLAIFVLLLGVSFTGCSDSKEKNGTESTNRVQDEKSNKNSNNEEKTTKAEDSDEGTVEGYVYYAPKRMWEIPEKDKLVDWALERMYENFPKGDARIIENQDLSVDELVKSMTTIRDVYPPTPLDETNFLISADRKRNLSFLYYDMEHSDTKVDPTLVIYLDKNFYINENYKTTSFKDNKTAYKTDKESILNRYPCLEAFLEKPDEEFTVEAYKRVDSDLNETDNGKSLLFIIKGKTYLLGGIAVYDDTMYETALTLIYAKKNESGKYSGLRFVPQNDLTINKDSSLTDAYNTSENKQ